MNITRALVLLAVAGTAATAFSLSMSSSSKSSSSASKSSVDRRSFVGAAAGVSVTALVSGVAPVLAEDDPFADFTTTESGMKYKILKEGTGAIPLPNQTVKAVRIVLL